MIIVHTRADQLLPQLLMVQLDILPSQNRHIEHLMLKFYCLNKWQVCELRLFFQIVLNRGYTFVMIVLTQADQLLSQLLMD